MKKTKDEVINQAIDNTEKMEFSCKTMKETLMGLLGEEEQMMEELFPMETGPKMYVVTLPNAVDGASILACKDSLSKIVEKIGEDCFILPSSVHEILLVPKGSGVELSDLQAMVCDVNCTEVQASEILSDHVYEFERNSRKLSIAKVNKDDERKDFLKKVSLSM